MNDFTMLERLIGRFASESVPGCGCIVMKDGEKLFEKYAGYADLENRIPVGENSLFRLYSMTKLYICTAAMIQFERGAFALNDPFGDYLPEYKASVVAEPSLSGGYTLRPAAEPIRVKHVLNMACGLPYPSGTSSHPTDTGILSVREKLSAKGPYTLQDDVRAIGSVPLKYDPGTRWSYGVGHDLAAALVEVTSGMTIGEFLKKEIFDPLGLTHTAYRYSEATEKDLVRFYDKAEDGHFVWDGGKRDALHRPDAIYEGGGSGLMSNLADYALFSQMLANGGVGNGCRILGRHTIDMMRKNMLNDVQMKDFTNTYLDGYGYGLGVRTMVDPAGVSNSPAGEFGWTGMAGTWVSIAPEEKLSVVYMHNMLPNEEEYHHMRVRAAAYAGLD